MAGQASWARNGMCFLPAATSRPAGLGLGRIVCKKESRKCDVHASSLPSSKQRGPFCLPFLEFSFFGHFLVRPAVAAFGSGAERGGRASGTSWLPSNSLTNTSTHPRQHQQAAVAETL